MAPQLQPKPVRPPQERRLFGVRAPQAVTDQGLETLETWVRRSCSGPTTIRWEDCRDLGPGFHLNGFLCQAQQRLIAQSETE